MRTSIGLALLACGALLLVSCESDASRAERAGQIPPAARHGIHSEQLRAIMAGMGEQVRQAWPNESDSSARENVPFSAERYEYISQAASRLANAAPSIPQAVPERTLAGPSRQTFLQLVAQLESQARGVQKEAAAHNRFAMDSAVKQLRSTCTSCHLQFREVAGPGPLGWGY